MLFRSLPVALDGPRGRGRLRNFHHLSCAPADNLVERIDAFLRFRLGMVNFAVLEEDAAMLAVMPDEIQGNAFAAKTFELDDVERRQLGERGGEPRGGLTEVPEHADS